jgi:thioredoxin 1
VLYASASHLAWTLRNSLLMLNKNEKLNANETIAPIMHLGEVSFEAEVVRSKQPVLVAFWAPWSRPCQVLDPVLQELASALAGRASVVRVNADENLSLSLLYDIQSIPTLLYFVQGKPRVRIVGTATRHAILAKLDPIGFLNETVTSARNDPGEGRQPKKEN